jgi:hypothetical protein
VVEVHLANQIDDFVHRVKKADIDEGKLTAAVDQVNIDSQTAPRLVVHFDDVGEYVFALEHVS